jgi:hypothetical protein
MRTMRVKAIEPVGTIKQGEIFDVIEIIDQVYLLNNQNYYSQKHFMEEVTSGITSIEFNKTSPIKETNCHQDELGASHCNCDQ